MDESGDAGKAGNGTGGTAGSGPGTKPGSGSPALRKGIRLSLRLALGLFAAGFVVACAAVLYIGVLRPRAEDKVERSFTVYIEEVARAGKIVLVEARKRLVIRETTPGRLFGDSDVGLFLNLRSDAIVDASAWAELSFAVDLADGAGWSVDYTRADGGRLAIAAPPLGMLTPAILTDTVEVTVADRSIFLDEDRLVDNARRGLTERFIEAASAMLDDPGIREEAAGALADLGRIFAAELGVPAAVIDVHFAVPED